jgi:hypothetical protein
MGEPVVPVVGVLQPLPASTLVVRLAQNGNHSAKTKMAAPKCWIPHPLVH